MITILKTSNIDVTYSILVANTGFLYYEVVGEAEVTLAGFKITGFGFIPTAGLSRVGVYIRKPADEFGGLVLGRRSDIANRYDGTYVSGHGEFEDLVDGQPTEEALKYSRVDIDINGPQSKKVADEEARANEKKGEKKGEKK